MSHTERAIVVASNIAEPLTAERLAEVLHEAGYECFTRARGAGSTDGLAAAEPASWDVLVLGDDPARAHALVAEELAAIERDAAENARLADEESRTGESPVPPKEGDQG